jgi:hypothetical protein
MTGLRTTSKGWFSTYALSQFGGQVKTASVLTAECLNGGVHPSNLCPNLCPPRA